MSADVFISYSSYDQPTALAVCSALENRGVACWIAPRDILPGTEWSVAIIDGIQAARAMVLIFSAHSNESPQVLREVERAVSQRIPILPFRIEPTPLSKSMQYFISVPHWFDALEPPLETHLERLNETLLRLLASPEEASELTLASPVLSAPVPAVTLHNLPRQISPFIGREAEKVQVRSLLASAPLVTIMGAGGCGKTRLALEVANDALPDFADGIFLVELAPLSDPALVIQETATALELQETQGTPLSQIVTDHLKARSLLLLLDNCEHLLDACARWVQTLLRACPHLKILVTSRELLALQGEQTYRVPPLSLPEPHQALQIETLLNYDAPRLFVERATLAQPAFTVQETNLSLIVDLCRQLDGIPLALELAAARMRAMSLPQLAQRLEDRFKLLSGGGRERLPHHQTLRATLDWSYELLTPSEKSLLERLSLFAGGWTLVASEAICAGEGIETWDVLDLLMALMDKSLVVFEEREGEGRYRLLESVRQYALEKLMDAPLYRLRHRDYFLSLAEEARQKFDGPDVFESVRLLETEHDNLRAALAFCREDPESGEFGLRLTAALREFWILHGYLTEGREHLRSVLSHPQAAHFRKPYAVNLNGAGSLAALQGDYAAGRKLMEQSLTIVRELGDKQMMASLMNNLANIAYLQGDYPTSRSLQEESLTLKRESGDKIMIAASLGNLALVMLDLGDLAAARSLQEESLSLRREMGDKHGIAMSLGNLGNVLEDLDDMEAAGRLYEESLKIYQELGDKHGIATALSGLGAVAYHQGEWEKAVRFHNESLNLLRDLGDKQAIAIVLNYLGLVDIERSDLLQARARLEECLAIYRTVENTNDIASTLACFALLSAQEQRPVHAVRLIAAADRLHAASGLPLPAPTGKNLDVILADLSHTLGDAAYQAAWQEGSAFALDAAVDLALRI